MSLKAAMLFASRVIFPRGSKKTIGTKSITGAIICIALSLIPLVVILSVSDGMIEGISKRLINLSSSHIQLQFDFIGEGAINKNVLDETLDKVKNVEGVTDAYELISTTGLVSSVKARTGATIRAVEPSVFSTVDSYKELFHVTEGNISDFSDGKGRNALIGKGIAENLNLKPGDTIRLITTQKAGDKLLPKMTPFKVRGIISSGYQEMDALWVFIPIDESLQILKPDNSTASIMVETDDPFNKKTSLRRIQNEVEKASGFLASCYRWDEINKSQYENFSSTKMLLVFIMMLIVLVACVNISSCIVMLSMERKKEIAILKSFGTSESTISMAFIFTGLAIGLSGILIGIPSGLIISKNINPLIKFIELIVNLFARAGYLIANGNLDSFYSIKIMDETYYLDTVPVHIPYYQILGYIIITLILSLLTSLIPALKAGKEKTIDTFRKAGA